MAGVTFPFSGNDGNMYGIDPGRKDYAAATHAAFTKDQWQNYISQFVPIENELIDWAMDPATVTKSRERAVSGIGQQYDVAQGAAERRRRGLGITLTPDEKASADRYSNLQKSLGEVQASNTARDLTVDRQRAIMGSPVTPGR